MSTTRAEYIAQIAPLAVAARTEYPALFPSLAIAQAILESGNGQSDLARVYHNHFGIKANKAWRGKVVSLKTKEVYDSKEVTVVDGFRAYDSPEDSFRDRNRFLARNRRYTTNGVFSAATPQEQAKALQRAGYATDPNYANKLIDLIAGEGLERYDRLPETATSGYVQVEGATNPPTVTVTKVSPDITISAYTPLINKPQGAPIQVGVDYRTTPLSPTTDHPKPPVAGAPILPVRPPVTPPPAPPPIPIPEPPPRKRSWIELLLTWIRRS